MPVLQIKIIRTANCIKMNQLRNFITKTYLTIPKSILCVRAFASSENPFTKTFPSPEELTRKEVENALDIETSLFENSSKSHQPTSAAPQLLKNYTRKVRESYATKPAQRVQKPKFNSKNYEPTIIDDKALGLSFTKLKLNDPILNNLLTTVRSRKRRDKNGQIIIEGRRLILEALDSGLKLQTIVFSQKDQLELISEQISPLKKAIEIYKVPQHDLKTWSTLTTPPGLLAIFERPLDEKLQFPAEYEQFPITVICDNIREPNNLGSIIRACAAIPCQRVIVLKGCCDPWETKALRGGCGAQFRIQIKDDIEWNQVLDYLPDEFSTFAAENSLKKVMNYRFSIPKEQLIRPYLDIGGDSPHYVIIIGGEAHGISNEAYEFVDLAGNNGSFIHIPLANGVESLNTSCALSLILFEIRRQTEQKVQSNTVDDDNKYVHVE